MTTAQVQHNGGATVMDDGRQRGARRQRPTYRTLEERVGSGKAARRDVPLASHADVAPRQKSDDPVALLESQAATRVPELVPIRYGRMLVSPFTFYRGAALIMAADLAKAPNS